MTIVERIIEEKGDAHVGILSFVSNAIDMTVFNNQFYISINDKLLIGNVNFPSKYKKRFMNMAKEIIMSVEKEEENGSDNPS